MYGETLNPYGSYSAWKMRGNQVRFMEKGGGLALVPWIKSPSSASRLHVVNDVKVNLLRRGGVTILVKGS